MENGVTVQLMEALQKGTIKIVDLTQPLHEGTPVIRLPEPFANDPGFQKHLLSRYDDKGPDWYWNWLTIGEHTGTHFDAPCHWVSGKDKACVDAVPPEHMVGPAVVIDVREQVKNDPDYLLGLEEIQNWEKAHGQIPENSWVLMRIGWSERGNDAERFLNVGADGRPHWPGFSQDSATFLTQRRSVLGVGTEAVGTDGASAAGHVPPFPNHRIMHGAGKYGLTSLINLDQLPPRGALLLAAPLKIRGGSGSPLRVLALVPS